MSNKPEPTWVSDCGRATLYCGDCLEILPHLEPGSVDAVVTDPPYGIGMHNVFIPNSNRRGQKVVIPPSRWDDNHASGVLPILKSICDTRIIWGANYTNGFDDAGGALVWDKKQPLENLSQCEIASVSGYKKVFKYEQRWTNFVNTKETEHPTEKPVDLFVWIANRFTKTSQTVLDPFMGSGTTGVACIKTGRKFVGIELEPKYFEIAKRRIKEELESSLFLQDAS